MAYILQMSYLAIGTVISVESQAWEHTWFATVWAIIITGGIYFSLTVKSKWFALLSTGFVAWFFSMFVFELISIFKPEEVLNVDKPSATYTWYLLAFVAYVIIMTLRYGKRSHN